LKETKALEKQIKHFKKHDEMYDIDPDFEEKSDLTAS
jgi:hypothetical protein